MSKLQRGFIGQSEIKSAIAELKDRFKNDNLFISSKMQGRIISCIRYRNLDELLDVKQSIISFSSYNEYIGYNLKLYYDEYNIDDDVYHDEIKNLFSNYPKNVYLCENYESGHYFINTNRDFCIKQLLETEFEEIYFYTYLEALENLESKYVNEDLVIGILS